MIDLEHRRFLFVTGKGGVGKTTVTAALAAALAASGKRVLVAVTGAKERVSELLGVAPLGTEIRELRPNLSGVLLRSEIALREYGQMKLKSRVLVDAIFDNRYVQGFFAGAPGLKEWALLGKAWYHSIELVDGEPRFDVVLFDAPATGHGLDMLRVPKVIVELAPPGLLRADAERAWRTFQDPKQSGVVVVTLPEELPVNETEELVAALRTDLRLPIAALIVNAVRPELFAAGARQALSALASAPPAGRLPGDAAVAAGIRRAVREGIQSDCQRRLRALGVREIELPLLIGGASSKEALGTLATRLTEAWSS
ncbi:MAG TPA: ArsA family ATPase [Polyangiaceae bacterium]|nr:ArsA family ATPase [Polyangiaceae bacterium]